METIYWKDAIKKGYKIILTKTGWMAANKIVFWNRGEAHAAHAALKNRGQIEVTTMLDGVRYCKTIYRQNAWYWWMIADMMRLVSILKRWRLR